MVANEKYLLSRQSFQGRLNWIIQRIELLPFTLIQNVIRTHLYGLDVSRYLFFGF